MNTLNFTVASSTATKNGLYCNKLVNKSEISVQTEFGTVSSERQYTLYMFTDKQNPVGMSASLNLDNFDIVTKEYDVNGETIPLKYAYPKR